MKLYAFTGSPQFTDYPCPLLEICQEITFPHYWRFVKEILPFVDELLKVCSELTKVVIVLELKLSKLGLVDRFSSWCEIPLWVDLNREAIAAPAWLSIAQ